MKTGGFIQDVFVLLMEINDLDNRNLFLSAFSILQFKSRMNSNSQYY